MENEIRLINANEIPWCNYYLDNYHSFVGVEKEYVDDMPTIDPESLRPKGRWEVICHYPYPDTMRCSVCKKEFKEDTSWKVCPKCLAVMDGGSDHG